MPIPGADHYDQANCAGIGPELHVVAIDEGTLLHNIRFADGHWQGFIPVGSGYENAACANVGSDLHVVAANPDGVIYHNIRFADQHWQGFIKVIGSLP